MKVGSISASRLIPPIVMLVALCAGVGIGEARASAEPAAIETAPSDFKARVEALVHSWFAVLEDSAVEANTLSSLLAEPPFELVLNGTVLHDRPALLAWVSDLRATYPQIEYQLDSIRVQAEAQDLYRVHFEFNRRALDDAGLSHVARRKHTWIVQTESNAKPVILRIEEQPLLFYSGTGPQVVCY
jgi:hypothetical protein